MRQREDGVTLVYSKGDGSCFVLPRSDFEQVKEAFLGGKAFYEGRGFYGGNIIIKLGDINGVNQCSPEVMRLAREDSAADKREDAIE